MESRSASKRVRAPVADPGMLDLEHVDFDGEGEEESLLAMTSAMTTLIGTMRYSVKLMPRLLFWRRKSPIRRRTSSRICGVIGRLFCCGVTYCDFAHHDSIEVDSGGVVVCLPELSWDDKISSRLNSSLLVHEFL
ncbi:uncharacterized protein LOC134192532 isoform X2 [Corticium candelabrum]|uniref:uncharacterized protein LOC134192532 isoform X2 n=1 Tax=Corticium candelabrum TaxID=121492 RepID=UPI002E263039|nr:uncharacterized protein LOC134192532 isoform X2 [Corticium candelabrum]